jgi:hypothetical protein
MIFTDGKYDNTIAQKKENISMFWGIISCDIFQVKISDGNHQL